MKTWIRECDYLRFRDEIDQLKSPFISTPEGHYVKFTGAEARYFFDFVLDQTITEGIPGYGSTSMQIWVAKDDLHNFNNSLRLLNSTLFTYRYTQETPNLVLAEFVVTVRKTQLPISVVIPAYNSHIPGLKRCLASVLYAIDATESAASSEIIVIDDCSSNSEDIQSLLHTTYGAEQRVRYFRLPQNSGVATARNTGVSHAKHPLVCFLDHDDNIEITHINLCVQELERGGVDLVATNMRFPDQHIFCAHLSEHKGFLIENGFGSGVAINTSSPNVKALLGADQLYNVKNKDHFEDWELNSLAKLLGWRMVIVPFASYFYEYTDTGRDSTNLSLKRRSGLTTPLFAIQRVQKISLGQAHYCLTEYCEALIHQLLDVEARYEKAAIELRRTQVAYTDAANSLVTTRHALDATNHALNATRDHCTEIHAQLFTLRATRENFLALAKDLVRVFEAKLARRKLAFFTYRLTFRPAIYGSYRSLRYLYRHLIKPWSVA